MASQKYSANFVEKSKMFNALKDQAVEIDTKIGKLRRQYTALAIGYVEKDESKQHSVREAITARKEELRECTADCDSLVEQTQSLFSLLTVADKAADEIYDSVIKLYHAHGIKVPSIDLKTIPVGIPIELLPLPDPPTAEQSTEEPASVEEHNNSDSEGASGEYASEIFISRPHDEPGLGPETPMIKSRKRLF